MAGGPDQTDPPGGPEGGAKNPGHRWQKGQSGNPKGRPKMNRAVVEACRAHTTTAINTLVEIMTRTKERERPGGNPDDGPELVPEYAPQVRLKAAQALLERAWGRPAQQFDPPPDEGVEAGPDGGRHYTITIVGSDGRPMRGP